MKGRYDIPLILGRLMLSKRLTSTQVLSQCAAMRGCTDRGFTNLDTRIEHKKHRGTIVAPLIYFCIYFRQNFQML